MALSDIRNVVVLMLENRSFDNVLGWLYEDSTPENFVPTDRREPFEGLQGKDLDQFANR